MFPVLPAVERPSLGDEWFSRASRDGSNPPNRLLFILLLYVYFVFFLVILFFFGFWQ
jgi:hypothetical protein